MSAAWYLAIMIKTGTGWTNDIKPVESETWCFKRAERAWESYWSTGAEDDSQMRVMCYEDPYNKRYWIRCTKMGSCSIK